MADRKINHWRIEKNYCETGAFLYIVMLDLIVMALNSRLSSIMKNYSIITAVQHSQKAFLSQLHTRPGCKLESLRLRFHSEISSSYIEIDLIGSTQFPFSGSFPRSNWQP